MNPANLQLEGLIMAVASLNRLLVEKGLLTPDEIDTALRSAEARITSDERFNDAEIKLTNRDAMCFPIRVLVLANGEQDCAAGFAALARQVGISKQPFNDQR
ncbi:MAG: hypothetical protein IOC86_15835 [Aestuariivirga sp.]|nr:hypothetical protein [Aestuariivirga sp.]